MPDFSKAPIAKATGTLIPRNTICPVQITLRPGKAGTGGLFTRNAAGDALMLDLEFTVVGGEYERRKFWGMFVIEGETDGQKQAASISGGLLRAILESARGIKPKDESAEAIAARQAEYEDFDGLRFWAGVGIEVGKGAYEGKDKNKLAFVVTPDRKEWTHLEQMPKGLDPMRPVTSPSAYTDGPALGGKGPMAPPVGQSAKPSWLK